MYCEVNFTIQNYSKCIGRLPILGINANREITIIVRDFFLIVSAYVVVQKYGRSTFTYFGGR